MNVECPEGHTSLAKRYDRDSGRHFIGWKCLECSKMYKSNNYKRSLGKLVTK